MLDVLAKTPLFRGIVRDDIRVVLKSLCAHEKSYRKGEIIVQAGATTRECGVVVRGAAVIEHGDIWGNVSIMGVIEVGVNFALPYACLGSEPLPFTVVARILSELLAIIGNFEGARFLGTHGIRQIRHDSPSNRLGRRMHRALYEVEVTTRTYF